MLQNSFIKLVFLVLTTIVIFTGVSCGKVPGDNTSISNKLIVNITQAADDAKRTKALEKLFTAGYSLGLVNDAGKQLNPNVSPGAASLTGDDIAALAYLSAEQQGRTLGSVVDYLASLGVTLAGTGNLINFKDFLPDLKRYVNWSFQNPSDSSAVLGLLLASGLDLKTPASTPVFTENTLISSAAALMMLGDILLGVPESKKVSSSGLFCKAVYAAEPQDTAKKIQGNLTLIESFLKTFKNKTVPEAAKQIIAAFAAGNRFSVRLVFPKYANSSQIPAVRHINLSSSKAGKSDDISALKLRAIIKSIPSGETLKEVPVTFNLNLISPGIGLASDTLYPDANAFMTTASGLQSKIEMNGHRMSIAAREPDAPADFAVWHDTATNTEVKLAILHASAYIKLPDLAPIKKEYAKVIETVEAFTALSLGEAEAAMQKGLEIAPWFAFVALYPGKVIFVEPDALSGGKVGTEYTFKARILLAEHLKVEDFKYEIIWFNDKPAPDDMWENSSEHPFSGDDFGEEAKIKWEKNGVYKLKAALYDKYKSIYDKVGEEEIEVNIGNVFSEADYLPPPAGFVQDDVNKKITASQIWTLYKRMAQIKNWRGEMVDRITGEIDISLYRCDSVKAAKENFAKGDKERRFEVNRLSRTIIVDNDTSFVITDIHEPGSFSGGYAVTYEIDDVSIYQNYIVYVRVQALGETETKALRDSMKAQLISLADRKGISP
jgi:hypothetical protein